ncbi:cytochrome P450 [Xylariaceae sp. AK1471]|nr:cytochrome P450 [Xylariaceae sp. AK1471]
MELPLIQPLTRALSPASEYLFARYPILAQIAERDDLLFLVFTVGALLLLLITVFTPRTKHGLPIVGYRSIFEPSWLLKLRFIQNSRGILKEGYDKYRDMFVIRRWTTDIVIIAENKYMEEIRAHTKDAVRSVEPFVLDLAGDFYHQGKVFIESDLQNRVLQQKLTPNLGNLIPIMKSELGFALQEELPDVEAEDWVEVDAINVFARSIARIVARIWIGPDECRNENWLEATTDYTQNIFATGFILRFVPWFLRPIVAPLLPTYRSMLKSSAHAQEIIDGLINNREGSTRTKSDGSKLSNDILQWMMEMAHGKELGRENLAERILILSLAAIHTTALTMAQALYDLCANSQYFDELREELVEVLRSEAEWNKTTLLKFAKLDSLLKESQRLNSVFLLTFNRFLPTPITLSNGVHLPRRTRIAVPQYTIMNDPVNVPGEDSAKFDPWRYEKLRKEPGNSQKYFFAMTDAQHMAFGYGKYACPGRFFASNEIKMVLAHLLLRYDWKFPEGQGRPQNFTIDSDMFPDPTKRIMMRKRTVEKGLEDLLAF